MKLKGGFASLQNAFHAQEMATKRDAVGNAKYHMDDNMRPTAAVQTPAQKMAVKKAAAASVRNRRVRAGLPPISVK